VELGHRSPQLAYGLEDDCRKSRQAHSGVDGATVEKIATGIGIDKFLHELREELRAGEYRPSPARRKWIPKPGKPGKFRPLGIPTVKDRVVQCAVKQVLEPIFEARFWPVSYGFRPGRGSQACLEHIRVTIQSRGKPAADGYRHRSPYQWVIEGDIEACFDNIGHHPLMERVRHGVADLKVNRLIVQFLKAGVLEHVTYSPTDTGTPQGGVLSPLLANIALSVIEERYRDWVRRPESPELKSDGIRLAAIKRDKDRKAGRTVFYPVRYADDFLIFVSGRKLTLLPKSRRWQPICTKRWV
jgi:group II intron reverse transcriptase/maturase